MEEEIIDITKGNPRLHPEFKRPILNNEQLDSIWFEAVNLFNKYNFFEISQKLLENATEETKQTIQFNQYFRKLRTICYSIKINKYTFFHYNPPLYTIGIYYHIPLVYTTPYLFFPYDFARLTTEIY